MRVQEYGHQVSFQVTRAMVPFAVVLVYYVNEYNELIAGATDLRVEGLLPNKVRSTKTKYTWFVRCDP